MKREGKIKRYKWKSDSIFSLVSFIGIENWLLLVSQKKKKKETTGILIPEKELFQLQKGRISFNHLEIVLGVASRDRGRNFFYKEM